MTIPHCFKNFKRVVLGLSFLLLSITSRAEIPAGQTPICYLNGADGMKPPFRLEVPERLYRQYGIELVTLDMGTRGGVKTRAQRFVTAVQEILRRRPNFSCHLFAYSMGGIVARYSFAKLSAPQRADSTEIAWKDLFPTFTTFSSPHRGTPVADLLGEFYPELMGSGLETLSERSLGLVNDPSLPSFWPLPPMPIYSYGSYLRDSREAVSFTQKIVFGFLQRDGELRHLDPRNDGMIPLRAQSYGTHMATLIVPHSYFAYDQQLLPYYKYSLVDLFALHWSCLENAPTKLLEDFRATNFFESAEITRICKQSRRDSSAP